MDANQVVVSPKVQGLLERLTVDEGSSVKSGEVIATLDTAELNADVEADRATVENLRAQLAQSESNYQVALNETTGDLASAQARLDMAKAQLAQSEAQLKRTEAARFIRFKLSPVGFALSPILIRSHMRWTA